MAHLAVTQHNPSEVEQQFQMKPFEWYNLHVRKEGQKVLTEQEYITLVRKRMKERNQLSFSQAEQEFLKLKQYPITPNDATPGK